MRQDLTTETHVKDKDALLRQDAQCVENFPKPIVAEKIA